MLTSPNNVGVPTDDIVQRQPASRGALAGSWTEIYELLTEPHSLALFLTKATHLASSTFADHPSCGISLAATERRPWMQTASDDFASALDFVQRSASEAPAVEAMDAGAGRTIDDVQTEQRWPTFILPARLHGLGSMATVPLSVPSGTAVGALSMYSTSTYAYSADDQRRLKMFSANLSVPLAIALRLSGHRQDSVDLRHAAQTRGVIGQAIGIIMSASRCTSDEAFAQLRAASRDGNRKLREIAADIVEAIGGQRPDVSAPEAPAITR